MKEYVDIIIAAYDRPEVAKCIESLQNSYSLINNILLCSPRQGDSKKMLEKYRSLFPIKHIELDITPFNKSQIINAAIKESTGKYILISDADILWNFETLESLIGAVCTDNSIAYVANVVETDKSAYALKYQRYKAEVSVLRQKYIVKVSHDLSNSSMRPGYGLVIASRAAYLALGGFKIFSGWGWEDVDFLIRGQILGYRVQAIGYVTHMSHKRASYKVLKKQRDLNILQSTCELEKGRILAPLAISSFK